MFKFLVLFILISLKVHANADVDPSFWSLRYLARASNFLLAANDSLLEKKPALCGLKEGEPAAMSQNLKILIDEKIRSLTARQKQVIHSQIPQCEQDCSCDIFSLYAENNSKLNLKVPNTPPDRRLTCAEQFKEFCSSRLIKALR